jgi:glucan biosynthesis protein C
MNQKITGDRLHGLDALRAIAMFLGVVLHAAIAYKVVAIPTWPHDNASTNYCWDFLYSFIHSFRMPLFYLIAGFFCRMLFIKIGQQAFIQHRIKRILIPFVCSVIILLPLTIFPFLLYKNLLNTSWDWHTSLSLSGKQLLRWNGMAHFWFLYYLLFYYAAFIVFSKILAQPALKHKVVKLTASIRDNKQWNVYLIAGCILIVFALLLLNKELLFGVDTGIVPNLIYLSFYGLFFFAGCLINIRSGYFEYIKKNTWTLFIPGLLISGFSFYLEFLSGTSAGGVGHAILIKGLFAIQCVLLVNGFLGLFLKWFTKDSVMWRYFSDASYWVYLLHLGIIAMLQILLINKEMISGAKFAIVLLGTTVICLITYHLLVRFTIIGKYLHGTRKKNQ